jgi:UDP-2,4-diacetamido-2,4,6-trideoxy-beta-L-altropyranose hydrolase
VLKKNFSRSAVFRFDCGPNIGLGHAVRCLAVVDALHGMGIDCVVAYKQQSHDHLPHHLLDWVKTIAIPDEFELFDVFPDTNDSSPGLLIVDHYGDGRHNLSAAEFQSSLKVLFDDFDAHTDLPCEVFINPNRVVESSPSERQLCLLGPRYAPIRSEIRQFAGQWKLCSRQNAVDECLISIGSTDPFNLTSSILSSLAQLEQSQYFKFTVLLASGAPYVKAVRDLCSSLKTALLAEVVLDAKDIGRRYKQAHCCIGAAGSSAWERCCVGLPTAQVVVADNQQHIQDELVRSGAVVDLPHPDDSCFTTILASFLQSAKERDASFIAMSQRARALVDGNGAARIAEVLEQELNT